MKIWIILFFLITFNLKIHIYSHFIIVNSWRKQRIKKIFWRFADRASQYIYLNN